tara:strand:- start:77 stop:883 length:807 start_codon:yes stop_codon:yes gene_type:complete
MATEHKKIIFIYGMQRTGMHAIINWIESQHEGTKLFLNNKEPWREDRPFLDEGDKKRLGKPRDLVIVSYEDFDFTLQKDKAFRSKMHKREQSFGHTDNRFNVVILRDPFNLFASRLFTILKNQKGKDRIERKIGQKMGEDKVELWKSYAREFVYTTIMDNRVLVNYNQWFKDKEYRETVADHLDIKFTDAGIMSVPKYGKNPSSFDGVKYDGNAQKMQVFARWQMVRNDPRFLQIFEDKELVRLSDLIFEKIPGTETLHEKIDFDADD